VGNNSKEPMCLQGYARVSHFSAAQYWKETDISSESRLDVAWWAIKSFGTAMEPKSESSALFIRKRGVRSARHNDNETGLAFMPSTTFEL
jgi:hypothetical protein